VEKPTLDRFPETVEISVEALTCFAPVASISDYLFPMVDRVHQVHVRPSMIRPSAA
jgi:hypothetical protein